MGKKFLELDDRDHGHQVGEDFIRLGEMSRALPAAPRFFFGSFPEELASLFFSRLVVKPQGIWTIDQVKVSGSWLISKEEAFLYSSALRTLPPIIEQELSRLLHRQGTRPIARRLPGTYVMLVDPGYRVYGHWLVDILPKLYLLHVGGYQLETLNFLIPKDTPGFALRWLGLLGISREQLVFHDSVVEELSIGTLLVPTGFRNGNRFARCFAEAVQFVRSRIEGQTGPLGSRSSPRRLFISRTSRSRLCVNRERIEGLASKSGFSLIAPELMPLTEQLDLFANARQIIGEYGSALHGSIFSSSGTIVCGLRSTSTKHAAFIQSGIGEVLQQPTGYVMGNQIGDGESFEIPESRFIDCLRLVFGGASV